MGKWGTNKKPIPDRILIYLYEHPQGATTGELSAELSLRVRTVLESGHRLEREGFVVGTMHEEPRGAGNGRAQKLWKVAP